MAIIMNEFDVVVYLRGRVEYLKAQARIWESGSSKARCADARLSEVTELLSILDPERRKNVQ